MLNKNQLFVNVLKDVLCNRGITSHQLREMDQENLGEIIAKKGFFDEECSPEFVLGELLKEAEDKTEELINPKIEDFIINVILDKGDNDEKQLLAEYFEAHRKCEEITRTLVSLVPNYADESKHFYDTINELADYIERYSKME